MEVYLSTHREPMPKWLSKYKIGATPDLLAFAQSRTVFYPGSGYDGQPVKLFGSTHSAHCFIYVDYGLSQQQTVDPLDDRFEKFLGYKTIHRRILSESEITPQGWQPHLTLDEVGESPYRFVQAAPFGFLDILEREQSYDDSHGSARLALLFLGADGVASYDALFSQKTWKSPFCVVLQDHGWGGNHTNFGASGLLALVAERICVLPKYLLVAQNTQCWSGYGLVPNLVPVYGGRGNIPHTRELFEQIDTISGGEATSNDSTLSTGIKTDPTGMTTVVEVGKLLQPAEPVEPLASAEDAFNRRLGANEWPRRVVDAITRHFQGRAEVECHYTMTEGGDFRVRAARQTPSGHTAKQNVATFLWQRNNMCLRCELFAVPLELNLGESATEPRQIVDPLKYQFKFKLDISLSEEAFSLKVASLIRIIEYAIHVCDGGPEVVGH